MSEQKYTLGEAAMAFILAAIVLPGFFLLPIPVDLGLAWMRTQIWNWFFVSYLHLPHMSVWLMFAIMLFAAMFRASTRSLKKEYYSSSWWASTVAGWGCECVIFAILYGVHRWFLL